MINYYRTIKHTYLLQQSISLADYQKKKIPIPTGGTGTFLFYMS